MEDSDDDIMILEEVNPHNMKSKKWKYKAPNPTLGSEDAQEVLKNVREKLNMQNPVMFGVKDKRNVINSRRNKLRLIKEPTKSKVQILEPCMVQEKTPKKSVPEQAPLLLSPKDILELTENCLDSDNEPCSNSVETPQSQQHGLPISSGPRKALSFSAKTSCSVRFNASKFFGAGTSSAEVNEILSQENMIHLSPTKSPSSKKKRLSKHSPIRLLPSHRNLGKSPGKRSPGKRSPGKLGTEFHSPTKSNSGFWNQEISTPGISKLPNETETQTYDGETIAEGPYYYEAFCFMIKKIYENLEHRHLFLETEIRKMSEVSTAKSEFQLYVRLMNRKDRWNRCSDISYEDIAKDLSPLFDFLEAHELISCNVSDMKLEGLLQLLKKDELKMVCDEFKVKKNGNKPNLVDALLSMHRSQPTLNGVSPLSKRVKALLGRCVKLNMIWRLVFRRCILLFSMFHSYEDLDALCSEQALLLLQVKLKNVVYPLQEIKNYQGSRIFSHRDQLIRFEEASELRQDLNNAIKIKDFKIVSNLTERGMKQFSTLLELTSETDHVLQLPSFLQRYSAGSMYARTLSTACDALKQGQMHKLALDVLELLLSQSIYCLRLKGEWLLKQATIYHVNIKDVVSASKVLCSALSDKSLSSVDRMHLQQRAEKVYKLKKNGLTSEYKKCLEMVMDPPCKAPEVIEITARAMLGSKPGLKKVYIRDTGDGKEFMSVEEVVIAHYRSLGFLCGVHDEGSTVSSLCLLSLWNVIYSTSVPSAFLSPYQIKPLDWGSKAFYKSRKNEIDAHFSRLQTKSVDFVANELCDLRTKYCQFSSLVNWDRLERLDIHAFLNCLSLPVFLAISRRLVEDWRSHRSGFPDLVLWSSQKKESLFVEVKSPNDTLSTVQSMWLNFLRDCGAKAFVVLIREAGSKGMMTA